MVTTLMTYSFRAHSYSSWELFRRFAARIHALSSLLHNPAHPGSVSADSVFRGGSPDADRPRMEAISVLYRTAFRHIRGLERTIVAPGPVLGAALSPDGTLLASVSHDRRARLWDPMTGRLVHVFDDHSGFIHGVGFSPDGRWLATAGFDRRVRVFEVVSRKLVRVLEGHTDWVSDVAFSPDGKRAVTGSDDGSAIVWDVSSGNPLLRINPGSAVSDVAYDPSGSAVLLGYSGAAAIYPLTFPDTTRDVGAVLRDAEAEAGVVLDGFELTVRSR